MKICFPFAKKTLKNSRLEEILRQVEMNASNNYKDAAQASLREFESALRDLISDGVMNKAQQTYYEEKLAALKEEFKKFTHADQKATWV